MVALKNRPSIGRAFGPAGPSQSRDDAGRRLRRDALPENTSYADTGCDIHPSCLTCPLVRCRYDDPGGARKIFSEERDRAIIQLSRDGRLTVDGLARRFGVSRRTVFRVLARARNRNPSPPGPSFGPAQDRLSHPSAALRAGWAEKANTLFPLLGQGLPLGTARDARENRSHR